MSSPVHDDGDKRTMYIPPWAREERDDEETRRLQAEIVAAAERAEAATAAAAAGRGNTAAKGFGAVSSFPDPVQRRSAESQRVR